jgi:hypothetical protein
MTLGNQPTVCSRTTRIPGLKKVTADASGFIALTPEGMAGTSQDLPEGAKVIYEEVPNKGKTSAENLTVG